MIVSLIAAVAENRVIGRNNELIWRLPNDMRFFKSTTSGHYVVLGRKTFDSFGKPLPNRTHVVITRNETFHYPGVLRASGIDEALEICRNGGETEVFVLGGGEIYQQSMKHADKLYITEVKASFDGDTYFPEFDKSDWREINREPHFKDEKHAYDYSFVIYERTKHD